MHTARLAVRTSGYLTRGHLHLDDYRTLFGYAEAASARPRIGGGSR